jgi:uncharacterized protein
MNADAGNGNAPLTRPAKRCPICGKPAIVRYRPFCSKRCADIDLGRWFGEAYRIPVEEEDAESTTPDDERHKNGEG